MIAVLVEVFDLAHLVKKVEHSNFDYFNAFREDFTESSSLREGAWCLFLLLLLFVLVLCGHQSLNKLDFQDNTVAIVDVSKAICTANWETFVDSIKVVVVGWRDVQEALEVLCVDLVLNKLLEGLNCLALLGRLSLFRGFRLAFKLGNDLSEDAI